MPGSMGGCRLVTQSRERKNMGGDGDLLLCVPAKPASWNQISVMQLHRTASVDTVRRPCRRAALGKRVRRGGYGMRA